MAKLITKANGVTQMSGRKSKLTPDLIERFGKAIEEVFYLTTACHYLEVSYPTVLRWIKEAQAHEKFHLNREDAPEDEECDSNCDPDLVAKRKFLTTFKRSQAKFNHTKMQNISKAGEQPRNWMANAWQLERTQPDKFGMKTRVENVNSGEIKHTISVSIDRRREILAAAKESLKIDTQPEKKAIQTKVSEDGTFVPVED